MTSILDQPITLALNSAWMPIGTRSVREAISAMTANPNEKDRAAVALDITYKQNEDGSYDFSQPLSMIPTKWADWVKLPVREFDSVIHSARLTLRAPTVVVAVNYSQMPKKNARAGKKAIYERDKGICQYTGKKLSYNAGTLDHVKPKSKGGKDTFENLVLCDPQVNHSKGNKSNKEAGLKLMRQPKAPLPVTVGSLIVDARHRDWNFFLLNRKKT